MTTAYLGTGDTVHCTLPTLAEQFESEKRPLPASIVVTGRHRVISSAARPNTQLVPSCMSYQPIACLLPSLVVITRVLIRVPPWQQAWPPVPPFVELVARDASPSGPPFVLLVSDESPPHDMISAALTAKV